MFLYRLAIGSLAALAIASATAAQEQETGKLLLELNALQPSETGCRVTFLAVNNLGLPLEKSAFEVALFDAAGAIDRLVSLDFKALANGKTKVLQFELQDLDCDQVSRILVNDVGACEGAGVSPDACLAQLTTSTRTKTQFGL
jgi:uncharacterized protein (DUF2141 family)